MSNIVSFKFPYRSEILVKEGDFVSQFKNIAKIVETTVSKTLDLSLYFDYTTDFSEKFKYNSDEFRQLFEVSKENFLENLKCNSGDIVTTETVLAVVPGMFKKNIFSPIDGVIDDISPDCFTILIRPKLNKKFISFPFFAKILVVHNLQIDMEILGKIFFGVFSYGNNSSGKLVVYNENITEIEMENSVVAIVDHVFRSDLYYILNSKAKGIVVSSCDAFLFDEIVEEIDRKQKRGENFTIIIKNGFGFTKKDSDYLNFIKKFEGFNVALMSKWSFTLKELKPALIVLEEEK